MNAELFQLRRETIFFFLYFIWPNVLTKCRYSVAWQELFSPHREPVLHSHWLFTVFSAVTHNRQVKTPEEVKTKILNFEFQHIQQMCWNSKVSFILLFKKPIFQCFGFFYSKSRKKLDLPTCCFYIYFLYYILAASTMNVVQPKAMFVYLQYTVV